MTDTAPRHPDDGVWDRLRRRKVVQCSVAYVAAAWALLQGLQFLADLYGWPLQALRLITLGLALGTQNLKAYELYLKSINASRQYTPASMNDAENYLEQATRLDPEFGLAWSGLATFRRKNDAPFRGDFACRLGIFCTSAPE